MAASGRISNFNVVALPKSSNMKDLLSIRDLNAKDALYLFEKADTYISTRDSNKAELAGRLLINLFFEESTRTRMSFDVAAKRLGVDVVNFELASSSTHKGETDLDTARSLDAMNPDFLVLRHPNKLLVTEVSKVVRCGVINAGNGQHEHPTQALLDAFTIYRHFGSIEGRNVAICGDVRHSRVALSNYLLLTKLGACVRFVGPEELACRTENEVNADRYHNLSDGLAECDVVMVLRIHHERMKQNKEPNFDVASYQHNWRIDHQALRYARPSAVVMHPGPINRNAEISSELADDPQRSLILKQISNGIAMRMAVLAYLAQ